MRLKIRENLRTGSLDPKFTRSNKKKGNTGPFFGKQVSFIIIQFGFQVYRRIVYPGAYLGGCHGVIIGSPV